MDMTIKATDFADSVLIKVLGEAIGKPETFDDFQSQRYHANRSYCLRLYYKGTRYYTKVNWFHALIGEPFDPESKQDVAMVLYSLSMDSRAGKLSFGAFCAEYGYSEDSRSAERTHRQCIKIRKQMERLFSGDINKFLSLEE